MVYKTLQQATQLLQLLNFCVPYVQHVFTHTHTHTQILPHSYQSVYLSTPQHPFLSAQRMVTSKRC